jgi:hypothetical protein
MADEDYRWGAAVFDLPIRKDAIIVQGVTMSGKPCRLVDNTGTTTEVALQGLLSDLIRARRFGFLMRSRSGENSISLDEPEFGHVQLEDRLYRLLVDRYEARLETF